MSPFMFSEIQSPKAEVIQQQSGSQSTQPPPRTGTQTSANARVPPLPAGNPLSRPPESQPPAASSLDDIYNRIFGQTARVFPWSTPEDGPGLNDTNRALQSLPQAPPASAGHIWGQPSRAQPEVRTTLFSSQPLGSTYQQLPDAIWYSQVEEQALQRVDDTHSEPTHSVWSSTARPAQRPHLSRPSEPTLNRAPFTAPDIPPPYSASSRRTSPTSGRWNLSSDHAGVGEASSLDGESLIAIFNDNPLSLMHDSSNPVSFTFADSSSMRWLIDTLDIEILAPTYLPTGSATVIIDYTADAMGALLQSSDIVDGDILMSCYRFSDDPVGWFRESEGMEFVQPEWGREWERYWVWGILYREGDVKVRVKRRVDVEEVRAWLGGSRVWTEVE